MLNLSKGAFLQPSRFFVPSICCKRLGFLVPRRSFKFHFLYVLALLSFRCIGKCLPTPTSFRNGILHRPSSFSLLCPLFPSESSLVTTRYSAPTATNLMRETSWSISLTSLNFTKPNFIPCLDLLVGMKMSITWPNRWKWIHILHIVQSSEKFVKNRLTPVVSSCPCSLFLPMHQAMVVSFFSPPRSLPEPLYLSNLSLSLSLSLSSRSLPAIEPIKQQIIS